MAPKKKGKKNRKDKEPETTGKQPIGADIAPDYVTEDLTGYRVPFRKE